MTRSKILIILSVFVLLLAGSAAALADYHEDFSKTLPLKAGERFSSTTSTAE